MSSARRNHAEVIIDVMRALSDGVDTPTQILYRANISWKTYQTILNALVSKGLAKTESKGKRKRHKLTHKGDSILRKLERAFSALSPITDSLEDSEPTKVRWMPVVPYRNRVKKSTPSES
jgi:predicted transcriptional regulator